MADDATRLAHLPALDGLRGVAVLAVIAYHFSLGGSGIPPLDGGFLGVDLFFVLSGFLITRLLLAEHRATGRIALGAFWLRRARRLLPALFLLLAVVVCVAATRPPIQRGILRWDIVASLGYVLNWRLAATGQSYFDTLTAPSPLRHLWSLAIEEQFYLLWPLLVGGALFLVHRYGRGASHRVFGALLAGIVGSAILLAAAFDAADPSRAYYGTHTRVHELFVGALAAIVVVRRLRRFLAFAGTAVVAALMATLTDRGAAYYYGGGLLFSLAAAALIVGVLDGRSPVARCLRWRPLMYVGGISYGLYLWHWPAVVWLTEQSTGASGAVLLLLRMAFTTIAAIASFVWLEQPVRSGRLVTGAHRAVTAAVCGVAVLLAATALATRGSLGVPAALTGGTDPEVHVAAGADTHTLALLGDSVAGNLAPNFQQEAGRRGWGSITAPVTGCEVGDLERVNPDGSRIYGRDSATYCQNKQVYRWQKLVKRFRPTIVFVHSRRDGYDVVERGRHLRAGTPEWLAAVHAEWDRMLAFLVANGTRTFVVILPAFRVGEIPQCESGPPDAGSRQCKPESDGFMGTGPLRYAYRSWAAKHDGRVRVVDLDTWLCPKPGERCPETVDGLRLRIEDGIHFFATGNEYMIPRIFDAAGITSD